MYRRTCLNVHPCVYDAYGMTVVEAAAFGAPSCVQRGDLVGCAALLRQIGNGIHSGGLDSEYYRGGSDDH